MWGRLHLESLVFCIQGRGVGQEYGPAPLAGFSPRQSTPGAAMEYVDLGISFVGGVACTLALGYAFWRHRKPLRTKRREDHFRIHIQPMLREVRNGLGTELSSEHKRFLIKEVGVVPAGRLQTPSSHELEPPTITGVVHVQRWPPVGCSED